MAGRKPQVLVSGRETILPTGDWVLGAGDVYSGTTQYQCGQLREYIVSGTTDANGRITVYPTTTGAVGGTALFSSILDPRCSSGVLSTTDPTAVPMFYPESISADRKTVVFRAVKGRVSLLTIGVNYSTLEFAGFGLSGYVRILGLP